MNKKIKMFVILSLTAVMLFGYVGNALALIPPIGYVEPENPAIYGKANRKLALMSGPGTKRFFKELGTYDASEQWVKVLAKAWDPNNGIWWVKVEYPSGSGFTGWTGYKRFYASTLDLDKVPTEVWY